MDELFENLEHYCIKHLESIEDYVEKHGEFQCSEMIDDMKDLVHTIKDMHQVLSMSAKKTL